MRGGGGCGWRRAGVAGGAVFAALFVCAPPSIAEFAVPQCDRYANADTGSDAGPGTQASPFRSVQKLVDSLSVDATGANDTGCLHGVFHELVDVTKPGASGHPVALTSYPGERARLDGRITVDASFVRIEALAIDGLGAPGHPVQLFAAQDELANNDISNAGNATCVDVGGLGAARATGAVVEGNAIHNCGTPGHNDEVGIDAGWATGARIAQNYVYANPARGIQLYPDAQGVEMLNNVVDGNRTGIQFAGDTSHASSNNQARLNIVTNNTDTNTGDYNIAHNWEGPSGTGNLVDGNCLDGPGGGIQPGQADVGPNNVTADPGYADRTHPPGGLALVAGTPCSGKGPQPDAHTGTAAAAANPRATDVVTGSLVGAVLPRWQPGSYHFEFGTSPSQLGGSTPSRPLAGDLGLASGVGPEGLGGLDPGKTYFYRLAVQTGSGTAVGDTRSFTTPPAPLLRPQFRVLLQQSAVTGKRGTPVRFFELQNVPRGARVRATCMPFRQGCPLQPLAFTTSRNRQHFLANRTIHPGAVLQIDVTSGTSSVRTTYRFRRGHDPSRSERCGAAGVFSACIAVDVQTRGAFVSFAQIHNPPHGARVGYICRGKGCPRRQRILAPNSGRVKFAELNHRRLKAGASLEIFVVKRKTVGVLTRFTLRNPVARRVDTCTTPNGFPTPMRCPAR
jgi:hypothetical protein